jgi:ATP-binding cassette subfamily C protein
MIARALIGKPQVLIFDEATSALDNVSQAVVTDSLNRLHATRIVIAHRLSTIRDADKIFVMERGRLVESGGFEDLMAGDGTFAALARRQLL